MKAEGKTEIKDKMIPDLKLLYRGVWAKNLVNNQELPVGGSMFSNELTLKLKLDFDNFAEQIKNFNKESIDALYEGKKEALIDWLKKVESDVDPYLFFVATQVQGTMQKLLEVDTQQ